MVTKADLRDRVLQELGELADSETASAGDAAVVERKIDEVHAKLADDQDNFWGALTNMPTSVQGAFVDMVAGASVKAFGIQGEDARAARFDAERGLISIRESGVESPSGPTQAEYF